jgi:anaerobic magnesium-protoporphyrin IX monomethyl ester cyclase
MKKILLIQVPTSHLGSGEKVYPIGLSRLAGLIPEGFKKSAIDMNLSADPWMDLHKIVFDIKPDFAVISFRNIDPLAGHHISYLSSLKTAALLIKRYSPVSTIMAGGPAFSLFPERLMTEIPEIDFGIKGEAEKVFCQLLKKPIDTRNIPGLIWRRNNQIVLNPKNTAVDMDDLPDIDTNCFDPKDYIKDNSYVAAIGIEGKRGCDLKCSYCVYPSIGGCGLRLRNPKKIVDDMEKLSIGHGIKLFHFTDSVLNRPVEHFEEVCKEIIKRSLHVSWTGFFREESFTDYSAGLAKKAGLVACYFSGDSLNTFGLKLLKKRLSIDELYKASMVSVKHDILTMCHFLVNLPFEKETHRKESEDTLKRLIDIHSKAGNLGAVIFNNIRLYPDAGITRTLIRSRLIKENTDLLFPVYYNPVDTSFFQHRLELLCHSAGVFSRIEHMERSNESNCS